jgi:adenylate cyclase
VVLRFADCELDVDRHELRRDGEVVAIEPQALRVLLALVENRDKVTAKNDLLDIVWGDRFVSESALTTQIKALRRAVGDTGRDQQVIKTVHGQGYMFVASVVEADDSTPEHRGIRTGPVIAVLPFHCVAADPGLAHFPQGLSHDVISALSKHRWFRVLTRAMTASCVDDPDPVSRLREAFDVDYVVDGAVRLGAGRMRVTVTLTDTVDGTCLWAERYDREIDDLFDVLEEIVDVVCASLEPEVGYSERSRITRGPRTNLRAWDLFHLAISHFFQFTAEGNLKAQELLAESRELDPSFGDAHAWWAYATVLGMSYWDTKPDPTMLDEALGAAQHALELDDHNAVFHLLRGRVQLARREYDSALHDNLRAIDLNPTLSAAFCGLGDSLCYEGRYDEAMVQFDRSVKLGVHDPQQWAFLSYGALALLFAHRYEEAIEWADRAIVIPNCQYWSTAHKVVAMAQLERWADATVAVKSLLSQCPAFTVEFARERLFYLKRSEQLELYLGGLAKAGVPDA